MHIDDEVTARMAKANAMKKTKACPLKVFEKTVIIKWQDKVPDTEALERAMMQHIYTVLNQVLLRWTGHVITMHDDQRKF